MIVHLASKYFYMLKSLKKNQRYQNVYGINTFNVKRVLCIVKNY